MPERTVEGLPVHGDIIGKYIVLQQPPSGTFWDVKAQRMCLDHIWQAMYGTDLSRPTCIAKVGKNGHLLIVRQWG